jgi:hypothetical protein
MMRSLRGGGGWPERTERCLRDPPLRDPPPEPGGGTGLSTGTTGSVAATPGNPTTTPAPTACDSEDGQRARTQSTEQQPHPGRRLMLRRLGCAASSLAEDPEAVAAPSPTAWRIIRNDFRLSPQSMQPAASIAPTVRPTATTASPAAHPPADSASTARPDSELPSPTAP